MKAALCTLVFLFLLGGCATTYTHPTKGTQEFELDRQECEAMARKALGKKAGES